MLKWFFRFILTLIVLVGLGGLVLVYFLATGVASPEPETVSSRVVTDNAPAQEIDSRMDGKAGEEVELKTKIEREALENQLARLQEQEAILENKRREVRQRIDSELGKIRGEYQKKLDREQQRVDQLFAEYKSQKEQEYQERALVKRELIEKSLAGMSEKYQREKVEELEAYHSQLTREYYSETLNLKLKLKVLELTAGEKQRYESRLKELEDQQSQEFEKKKEELEKEINARLKDLEERSNQDFLAYQQQLEEEINQELAERKSADRERLEVFLKEQQGLLNQDLKERRREIQDRSTAEIKRLEGLIKQLEEEYYRLQRSLDMKE